MFSRSSEMIKNSAGSKFNIETALYADMIDISWYNDVFSFSLKQLRQLMGYKTFMYTVFKLLVGADKAALLRNVTTQLLALEYQFVRVRNDILHFATSLPGS